MEKLNRADTTRLLTDILIHSRLSDRKYYAEEVTLDYGTIHPIRVDVMQFEPKGVMSGSDIEKGIFTCYEIKSCRADLYSGHGLNFIAEKNYIVTTMEMWKKTLQEDIRTGQLDKFIIRENDRAILNYGVLVAVPQLVDVKDTNEVYREYENPTPFGGEYCDWKLWTAQPCREGRRYRSMTELLFCMLRSKGNNGF